MTSWLPSLWDRPITERQRRHALAIVTVLLACATAFLILTRPAAHRPIRHARVSAAQASRADPPASAPTPAPSDDALPPAVVRVSRGFLHGYLAYLYGHGTASQIADATGELVRSLEADPPRVSPAMRQRAPRVLSLKNTPTPADEAGVSALISDGSLMTYRIGLLVQTQDGRPLVDALTGG